jgi:antitoxin VapB
MDEVRHVRLFRNGRNQAVRIPRDLELEGDEATIRRDGRSLIIEPVERPGLVDLLASWSPLDEEPAPIEDPPLAPEDVL